MSERYEIKTVSDFTKVPSDKVGECLQDFAEWLALMQQHKQIESLLDKLADTDGAFSTQKEVFVWVDDGKRGVSRVEFSVREADQ
ncbi:hypothetical protein MYE70_10510 [Marinobacter alexandrii]|uniref:hypothetical protein n=1 Tax=Marinobacter alexandrii TaxID=2570351 RepID=UPI0020001A3C|nr:hypothetical protein [Marinobacter alexandrii]MCK2149497.1 hypothetical protein [Marinobacter alexandrii]